jgi:hypothetical protein
LEQGWFWPKRWEVSESVVEYSEYFREYKGFYGGWRWKVGGVGEVVCAEIEDYKADWFDRFVDEFEFCFSAEKVDGFEDDRGERQRPFESFEIFLQGGDLFFTKQFEESDLHFAVAEFYNKADNKYGQERGPLPEADFGFYNKE